MHTFYKKNARVLAYMKKKLYICRLFVYKRPTPTLPMEEREVRKINRN